MDADSFAKWVPVAIQVAKCFQGDTSTDSVRSIIQEEMSKSQNQQNNETMRQMLTMIEQKHAAELHEATRERDLLKLEAEFLAKQLQELQRSKKAEDKNERMKELLTNFAQLKMNQQSNHSTNDRKDNQRRPHYQKNPQKGKQNNVESTLPWMDSPKSYPQTKFGENSDKKYNPEKKGYQKNFSHTDTKGENPPKQFDQDKKGYYQKNFQPNHHGMNDSQTAPRGHQSKRGAGRGQRGFNNRGRGRSASVGRNTYETQVGNSASLNDNTIQATASYHVQVTKNIGNQWQWVSSETLPSTPQPVNRGRGQQRGSGRGGEQRGSGRSGQQRGSGRGGQQRGSGGGRGQGRGRGNTHFQSHGNQHPSANKNRRKKRNEDMGDPEDNCVLS